MLLNRKVSDSPKACLFCIYLYGNFAALLNHKRLYDQNRSHPGGKDPRR